VRLGIPGLRVPRRDYLVQIERRDKWLGDDGLIFAFKSACKEVEAQRGAACKSSARKGFRSLTPAAGQIPTSGNHRRQLWTLSDIQGAPMVYPRDISAAHCALAVPVASVLLSAACGRNDLDPLAARPVALAAWGGIGRGPRLLGQSHQPLLRMGRVD
jgi:hypothetical protein